VTVRPANFLRDPRVEYLSALLEQLRDGALQMPHFQRPFVWDESRELELLRSVRDGIPIGSLMVWETQVAVSASETLGDRALPKGSRTPHRYLLDGQQRMATLFAALVPLAEGEVAPERQAWFDLELDDFVFLPAGTAKGQHLDLRVVLDAVKLRRATRQFPEAQEELWIERSDSIAAAFSAYKLAALTIATDDVEVAIRTFERINTQGVRMSGVDLIHALTWSEGFHLNDRLESLRDERLSPLGWGAIDDERILDACRLELELPFNDRGQDILALRLKHSPNALVRAVDHLTRAVVFLRDECLVKSPRLLPFRHQLLVVTEAMRGVQELSVEARGRLIAWFWVSTLTGWFEGEGARAKQRLDVTLRDIAAIVNGNVSQPFGDRTERTQLGPTLNPYSARGRALVLFLVNAGPLRANGERVDLDTFLDRDQLSLAWMLPRDRVGAGYASPGNRFTLSGQEMFEVRRELLNPRATWEVVRARAESHRINERAWGHLRAGRGEDFIAERRALLNQDEDAWLASNLAVFRTH
jgi:hypothetical protein